MRKITSLQAKEKLLKETLAIEKADRETEALETAEQRVELEKKKELQQQMDDEMSLRQEESRRKYLLNEFTRDASETGIPRSFVRLQQEHGSKKEIAAASAAAVIIGTLFFSAALTRLRTNCRGIMDFARDGHKNDQIIMSGIAELRALYNEVQKDVKAFSFYIQMGTEDVSNYFPANDNETINRFLLEDEDYKARRHGFYELLKTCVSVSQKKFGEAIINTLFTLHYKSNTRWPCSIR